MCANVVSVTTSGSTSVRFGESLRVLIQERADLERRSFSQMVRLLIERGLDGVVVLSEREAVPPAGAPIEQKAPSRAESAFRPDFKKER